MVGLKTIFYYLIINKNFSEVSHVYIKLSFRLEKSHFNKFFKFYSNKLSNDKIQAMKMVCNKVAKI